MRKQKHFKSQAVYYTYETNKNRKKNFCHKLTKTQIQWLSKWEVWLMTQMQIWLPKEYSMGTFPGGFPSVISPVQQG